MINGLDRLIMELKLPPTDAYHKSFGKEHLLWWQGCASLSQRLGCLAQAKIVYIHNVNSIYNIHNVNIHII